ncbi:GNAT family protein [Clostridiaceae bacterium M8S5]|nr:GNAT family protein [Clostridiaceae bacterium M8S5]
MDKYNLKNGSELIIRNATLEDAKELIELLNKGGGQTDFLPFGKDEYSLSVKELQNMLERFSKRDNLLYIVAEINSKIIGMLNFRSNNSKKTKHVGELGIMIDKESWGLSIGTHLINYLIVWAKANGITKINLRVREDNARGIRLYKKMGFVEEGILTKENFSNGKYYSCVFMGLDLEKK